MMDSHTIELTQNLIDFLSSMTMGEAERIGERYAAALQRVEGLSPELADDAVSEAMYELNSRLAKLATRNLFQS